MSGLSLIDARENVGASYTVAEQPLWTNLAPFTVAYTPTENGKIIVSVCGQGVDESGTTLYTLTLFINGLEVASLVRGLMWGTATTDTPTNLSFVYPFSVSSGVAQTIELKGQYEGASAGDGVFNVSWSVYFSSV